MNAERNVIKSMDYSPGDSNRNSKTLISANNDANRKGNSRGAKWCKLSFTASSRGVTRAERNLIKTKDYNYNIIVQGFGQ